MKLHLFYQHHYYSWTGQLEPKILKLGNSKKLLGLGAQQMYSTILYTPFFIVRSTMYRAAIEAVYTCSGIKAEDCASTNVA